MMLINSLLSHATESYWEEFTDELDHLNAGKAVLVMFLRLFPPFRS